MTGVRATATRDAPSPIREALSLLEGAMRFPEDAEMFAALSGPALVHLAALEAVADAARAAEDMLRIHARGVPLVAARHELNYALARLVAVQDGDCGGDSA